MRRPVSLSRRLSERAREGQEPPPAEGLIGALTQMLRQVEALQQQAGEAKPSVVFGYSVRMGLDGAEVQRFGHVPEAPSAAAEPAPREPLVEVQEEAEALLVVAEMPGVAAEAVTLELRDGALHIAAPPNWRRVVPLPVAVRAEGMGWSCHNGILEVRLLRAEAGA